MKSKPELILYLVFAILCTFVSEHRANTVPKAKKCGYESCPATKVLILKLIEYLEYINILEEKLGRNILWINYEYVTFRMGFSMSI